MELLETSRRYFKLDCDGKWNFDFGDIRACDGAVWFQRPAIHETHRYEFDTVESCRKWILQHEAAMMEGFDGNKRVDKNLYDVKAMALKMNDPEWQKVSQYMLNPDRFDPEKDVKVFRAYLANNFRDRDGERFTKEVLNSFNKSIVGKSKLIGHQWGPPGDGRFYASKVEKMTVDEAIDFVGAQPDKKFRDHLEYIADRDGGIFWLVPKYYMMNMTPEQQQAIINIDAGIWKDMSIGFRSPKKFAIFESGEEKEVEQGNIFRSPEKSEDGSPLMFYEFRNDKKTEAEALEGSHVFLGSQFGAGTTKSVEKIEGKIESLEKVVLAINDKISQQSVEKIHLPVQTGEIPVQQPADGDEKDLTLVEATKPYPNEHACRLKKPEEFSSFRRQKRNHEGKDYWAIIGFRPDKSSDDQAYRYPKNIWTEKEARVHCKSHDGIAFEPAIEEEKSLWVDIETIEDEEIKYYVQELDKLIVKDLDLNSIMKAVWTTAQINEFEDDCFAYVEDTGDEDDEGRTIPKNARHLPHHPKGGGASGTGGTVDLPHLRNALARVNQVKPVTDTISAAELRSKAKAHLVAHAKKLGIGDYESFVEAEASAAADDNANKIADADNGNGVNHDVGDEIMAKLFEFEALDVKMTVSDEKFEDDMKALQDALAKKQEEFDQSLADFEQKVSDLDDKVAQNDEALTELKTVKEELEGFKKSVVEVFGEDVKPEDMKLAKETAAAFRDYEINNRFMKYKGLMGMIDNEEEERKFLNDLPTAEITRHANYYEKELIKRNPQLQGILPINKDVLNTVPDPGNGKPESIQRPLSHYQL